VGDPPSTTIASHRDNRRAMASAPSTPYSARTAWARNLAAPVRDFLSTETGGAIAMVVAIALALLWANSPWSSTYESFWQTKLSIAVGHGRVTADLRHWVNQGLMTFFFLVVGLEAKRELDMGELRERRRLAIPVTAALGGMAGAVAIYLAFNLGGPGSRGWGAAMSTDTALALGALALLTPRGATRLRVFLLTLAVVDDLAALIVIAVAYTTHVSLPALAVAIGLFGLLIALRYAPAWRRQLSVVIGVALWVAMFKSGIDPVITGLAIGLVTSAYPPSREDLERAIALTRSFREQPTPELARSAQLGVLSAISPNERLQYGLHPWTSYVVVPLFALANAGIHITSGLLDDSISSPITLGILIGYVAGKPLGILGASWLASRPVLHGARPTLSWPSLAGGGAVAGIGFTVSLLIASLAFRAEPLAQAKLGVLASAILAPLVARGIFSLLKRLPRGVRARQIVGTAEDILDLSDDVDPARDHIRGSGLGFDLPDSRDQPVDSLSRALDRADPLGRARESIAAEMHGRCAGVIRATKEREFHSALAGDCFDGCKWLIQFLQYRTLFDVKLKVAERVVFQLGLRNLRGIQAELFDRLANGNALRILDLQKLPIQTTHQRAAADERSAEAYSFLFGKANHFDAERKPPSPQLFEQCDRKNNSENAIISASIGNSVEM